METEETTISDLELTEDILPDMLTPVENASKTKATTFSAIKNWLARFFVGKTGSETISGNKTLTGFTTFYRNKESAQFAIKLNTTVGNAPTTGKYYQFGYNDINGIRLADIEYSQLTDKNMVGLIVRNKDNTAYAGIRLHYFANNISYANCPTYAKNYETDKSEIIVTTKYGRKAGFSKAGSDYDDLTLSSSGQTYTAPESGWYVVNKGQGTGGKFLKIKNLTSGLEVSNSSSSYEHNVSLYMPARKGDIIQVTYDSTGEVKYFKFVYDNGAKD